MNQYYLTLTFFVLSLVQISAQTGKYDLSFCLFEVDYETNKLYIDIQIRAHDSTSTFYLSEQNYRFWFNRNAIKPGSGFIDRELDVSGLITSPTGQSLYDPHTLTGSLDSIVSYNITLAGGEGILVASDEWINVGRLGFEIIDFQQTAKFIYNGADKFPATYIGEAYQQERHLAEEGDLYNLEIDLSRYYDPSPLPQPVPTVQPELEQHITLFPTYTKAMIQLDCEDINCTSAMIIDAQGRVFQHLNNYAIAEQIDVSNLPNGIYFLHIRIKDVFVTRRFIKI